MSIRSKAWVLDAILLFCQLFCSIFSPLTSKPSLLDEKSHSELPMLIECIAELFLWHLGEMRSFALSKSDKDCCEEHRHQKTSFKVYVLPNVCFLASGPSLPVWYPISHSKKNVKLSNLKYRFCEYFKIITCSHIMTQKSFRPPISSYVWLLFFSCISIVVGI